jgi:3-oxoacyl-[acyl-carrier-protein] synthase-1
MLFPNLRFATPMKELRINPFTKVIKDIPVRNILSNSFGFGGNNSTLIISKTQ